ncbi:hypothetical protein BCR34DRAFT_614215 [Clohesyomyces aquaticus]|uniref:RRM domain-containing protein n=1 Tax=Clohesyomyces aquaticus TaxID=1231657 RepID=A0A1Y1ZPI5_9PLEO|nr:hypothetical protein BCR34DRAFT_614215 [Clohesyomyces aquaticus]
MDSSGRYRIHVNGGHTGSHQRFESEADYQKKARITESLAMAASRREFLPLSLKNFVPASESSSTAVENASQEKLAQVPQWVDTVIKHTAMENTANHSPTFLDGHLSVSPQPGQTPSSPSSGGWISSSVQWPVCEMKPRLTALQQAELTDALRELNPTTVNNRPRTPVKSDHLLKKMVAASRTSTFGKLEQTRAEFDTLSSKFEALRHTTTNGNRKEDPLPLDPKRALAEIKREVALREAKKTAAAKEQTTQPKTSDEIAQEIGRFLDAQGVDWRPIDAMTRFFWGDGPGSLKDQRQVQADLEHAFSEWEKIANIELEEQKEYEKRQRDAHLYTTVIVSNIAADAEVNDILELFWDFKVANVTFLVDREPLKRTRVAEVELYDKRSAECAVRIIQYGYIFGLKVETCPAFQG